MVDFEKMYDGSYYTITGCGGDLNDWKNGYEELLKKEDIGEIKEWEHFTGKEINSFYGLSGNVAYQNDLNFLAFPLDGLDIGKLTIFKIMMKDRWFDDIVDNNLMFMSNKISCKG